jgi:hypothetical protein
LKRYRRFGSGVDIEAFPRGLKPVPLSAVIGTDKSVPFQNMLEIEFFPQTVERVPFIGTSWHGSSHPSDVDPSPGTPESRALSKRVYCKCKSSLTEF